ncbi:hypothetical protein LL033_17380 [Clostridium estertheticum]|uniref:hypothetical protein n=1 Tax=Clostridium estertheticum TaxID=238834 RepID=UPI001C0E06D2|nr:hypothetical protein [Clostridium estertheticum]MBU3216658.1 hypothetical protein [Clostridium estertheticum]WAG54386.1 hypothetical protein LL033_17380 [Clostridium estertheticum]
MLYRTCAICNCKVQYGTLCACEIERENNRNKEYRTKRNKDKELKKRQVFYSKDVWLRLRDSIRSEYSNMCIMCLIADDVVIPSDYVHHIHTTEDYWNMRLQEDNLVTLCATHHACVHRDMNVSKREEQKIIKMLEDMIEEYEENYI